MKTENVAGGYKDIHGLSTQESNSLPLKVTAQLCRTASQIIHSINNIAQSILSKCIYVGSLGRCTLDDLKNYLFKNHTSLKPEASLGIVQTDEDIIIDRANMDDSESEVALDISFEDSSNIDRTREEEALEEERKKYGLTRQDSLISVTSSVYNRMKKPEGGEKGIYPDLSLLLVKKKKDSSYKGTQAPYGKDCSFALSDIEE